VLEGLFFDFDGTIGETERFGHRVAYNAAFREFGLDWHWDEELYGELLQVTGGKERLAWFIERERVPFGGIDDVAAFVRRLHDAKRRHFNALAPRILPRPGVSRLVHEAHKAGIRLAIVTTASPDGIAAFFTQDPDLLAAFDLVAAGDIVEKKKPAPDIYRSTLEELHLDPRACVAIEDSRAGLDASRAAQIATLVTVSTYTGGEDFPGAAAVLTDLGEPAAPASTLSGAHPPRGYVDVAFLASLIEGA
jgi:HAD superfamily hydrolase (TIGR01509 family)